MLTTKDNPYNPYTDFDEWRRWDMDNGYYTPELIARASNPSLDIDSDDMLDDLYDEACILIMETDMTDQYIMVKDPNESNNNEE